MEDEKMCHKNRLRDITFFVILLGIYIFSPLQNALCIAICAQENVQKARTSNQGQIIITDIEEDEMSSCLELGRELFFEQKYSDAITQLEKCLSQEPENPEIYYYIGQSYFEQGQLSAQKKNIISATKYYRQAYRVSEIAIEKYLRFIEGNPGEDHTNNYLRLAYIYEIRSYAPGIDEYQKAIDIYEKLLEENPFLNYANYHLGWIHYQQAEYQNAIDRFLIYLKPGFKSDFVYYYLGLSYDKMGENEQAKYYFQLILDEFPDSVMAGYAKKELK